MTGKTDLILQAASGSAAAQLGLVDAMIAAGASGAVRQIESLAAAETLARLAAAIGSKQENRVLVGVLLARAEFEASRGSAYNSDWYRNEARRVLRLLVALDDEEARRTLVDLGDVPSDDNSGPGAEVQCRLAAAARGDLDALGALCDEALHLFQDKRLDPIEALTTGELYARLASSSGHADHTRRLAGVLLKRAEYEYEQGWAALADNAVAEATVLLSILVDTGDHSMATWLSMLVNGSAISAISPAACHRPSILKFIEPKGAC